MEIKVCRNCKKMFQYITGPELCPKCKQIEEDMFQVVKEYLRDNPGANLYEINRDTGVSAALVEKFIRQGRLEVSADSPVALECERCGKKIKIGRYCNDCKNKMANELNDVKRTLVASQETHDTAKGAKMRYLKSDRLNHE